MNHIGVPTSRFWSLHQPDFEDFVKGSGLHPLLLGVLSNGQLGDLAVSIIWGLLVGVLMIRVLLFRGLSYGPSFLETPI